MFEPRFITRKEWKAWNFPVDKPLYPMVPMNVVIHHYGDFNNDSTSRTSEKFKGDSSIRKLQKKFKYDKKLLDIPYHYVIGADGNIYECRPPDRLGSHLLGKIGLHSIGIMLYGNFDVEIVPDKMKIALVTLLRKLKSEFSSLHFPECIKTHAEMQKKTKCPGKNLCIFVEKIRKHCQF